MLRVCAEAVVLRVCCAEVDNVEGAKGEGAEGVLRVC